MNTTNKDILSKLPSNVTRVSVLDAVTNKVKYKPPSAVTDQDQIQLNTVGAPIVMTGSPGRQRTPVLTPISNVVAEKLRAKAIFMDEDDLFSSVQENPEGTQVLDHVMRGLAEEAASLGFEREDAERQGHGTSQVSMRRINALKAVGDSWLKRREQLAQGSVDVHGPAFKKVYKFIVETVQDALLEDLHMRQEMVDTLFAALDKRQDEEWYKEASKRASGG